MSKLPQRPRGVRKHWKREVVSDISRIDWWEQWLSKHSFLGQFGQPAELVIFSFKGVTKRALMRFTHERTLDISFYKNGRFLMRMGRVA